MDDETNVEDVRKRIAELSLLTEEVGHSKAWELIVEEMSAHIADIDLEWQMLDAEKLFIAKVTKVGLLEVVNIIDRWHDELEALNTKLYEIENPDKVQSGDYDLETNIKGE